MARRSQRTLLILSLLAVGASACAGGSTTVGTAPAARPSPSATPSPSASPSPACSPSGAALQLAGQNVGSSYSYDTECLAAPAGTPLTITFDNQSPEVSHNVEILDHPGGTPLFTGKLIVGPKTITYKVKALEAGTYYFHCTVHPIRMNGDLMIGG